MEHTIFHGSDCIVNNPSLAKCRTNNDFGRGFYCTEDKELSKEWACRYNRSGYSNMYSIEMDDLNIVDLTDGTHETLEWLAFLVKNRIFNVQEGSIIEETRDFLLNTFDTSLDDIDVMIGFRADDSYFTYTQWFLNNAMSLESLEKAMFLGNLGKQTALISEKAIEHTRFIKYESVDAKIYGQKFKDRDLEARSQLKHLKGNAGKGRFILQIMEDYI